ncbi:MULTISPECIES: MFS transporter [Rhodococcus]|uniref:MFS transporter n=1 Tax=Rhodococcus oxybenzonivorans TaxID=1990687 RepID=A0AAE4UZZ4_9NOCA|nr:MULTISPECIES: MFS transporter [Rhodococcus]MDV7240568.1 MFS transporter [Rhodococcus oxybenzonivorans]MDV7265737.1 MFS transporter [Rhodococcus oxybenzonivorans]MDV7272841.1 MFS transporter [Rhodococcus oxybenzonivorans]MDV7333420.1 MFS transporter [Rhodococcus oxybenzonivorans]MDV7342587.1 MFS transporter [Rhodococcus oxybenzonivorans]
MTLGSPPRLNRWWYVATGSVALIFGSNTVNALFNVLGTPMAEEFGWERSVISTGFSIETILVGLSVVALGAMIDRLGPRRPAIPMAVGFGLGLMAMAAMPNNENIFYLFCILIGLCAGALAPVAHAAVVSAWFVDRRGLALGILMAGLGACGVLMPPLAAWIESLAGWRSTFIVIGAMCAAIPTAIYFFITRMPDEYDDERERARSEGRVGGQSLLHIARGTRQLWLLSAISFLVSAASFGLMSQVVPMTTDKGIDQGLAILALSIINFSSIFARLLTGYLFDKIFAPFVGSFFFILGAIGVALLISSYASAPLLIGAVLIGVVLGAETDLNAYLSSRYFPKHSYGRVFGFATFVYTLGAAFGVMLLARIYSTTGSYAAGIAPLVGMLIVAIVCLIGMGPYRYSRDSEKTVDSSDNNPMRTESASS